VPGPAGAAGQGVPVGGTAGQFLTKIDGTNYNTDWTTVNLSAYLTTSAAASTYYPLTNPSGYITSSSLSPYLLSSTAASTYQTLAGMSSYLTTSAAAAGYYPLSGNPSGFLTSASLSGYATESWVTGQGYITSAALTPYLTSATAASTYQTLSGMSDYLAKAGNLAGLANTGTARTNLGLGSLAVVNDAPSDGSQYARKNAAWNVVVPGDRYLTTSTTSNTVSNGNKTFTIGTGLSYTPTQNITISYDASNHMHGEVLTYNSGTGVLTVDINHHTGSGTYAAWVVNVGGVTPATSVAWGAITGTLSSQTDLQNALDLKLAATTAASTYQTLTGMSSYLTTSAAASTYQTQAAMSSYLTSSTAASTYATILEPSVDGILTVEPSGINTATVNVNQDANNYIHLRAGAGQISMVVGGSTRWFFNDTYLQFPGGTQQTVAYPGPSGFLLKADNLSGLANTGTARTNLGLGTMATATAADYSTTTVANGLYYPLSSNPAGYLTSAPVTSVAGRTGAITLAVADVSGAADLASPTFTGTPSLPTGTIGVTQSAGNNTTALATTAFVQQEVPDFATTSEIMSPSSTTKVLSPFDAVRMITNAAFFDTKAATGSFNTSGTGAEAYKVTNDRLLALGTPNAGIAGHGQNMFDTTASSWGLLAAKRGAFHYTQDWSKKIFASGTTMFNLIGDSATTTRVMIGGKAAFGTGSPTKQSIGWKLVGGGSNALVLVTYGYNGTSSVVTETTSSFTPVVNQAFDWFIYHEPNVSTPSLSKCYLYVNDNLVATGQNSPADATITFNYFLQGCESTGSHATRMAYYAFPTKIWWSRS
jgi:hypothetical protein